jgi:hypothetical protein
VPGPAPLRAGLKVAVCYYTLRCASSLPGFPSEEVKVKRRFSDFDQLHHMLRQHHQGYFVPPLPSKSFFESKVAHTDGFLRVRRVDLQVGGACLCWAFAGPLLGALGGEGARRGGAAAWVGPAGWLGPRHTAAACARLGAPPPPRSPGSWQQAGQLHLAASRPFGTQLVQLRCTTPAPGPRRPQAYVRAVASHPVLRTSEEIRLFLTLPGELNYQPQWVQLVEHRASMLDNIKGLIGGGRQRRQRPPEPPAPGPPRPPCRHLGLLPLAAGGSAAAAQGPRVAAPRAGLHRRAAALGPRVAAVDLAASPPPLSPLPPVGMDTYSSSTGGHGSGAQAAAAAGTSFLPSFITRVKSVLVGFPISPQGLSDDELALRATKEQLKELQVGGLRAGRGRGGGLAGRGGGGGAASGRGDQLLAKRASRLLPARTQRRRAQRGPLALIVAACAAALAIHGRVLLPRRCTCPARAAPRARWCATWRPCARTCRSWGAA